MGANILRCDGLESLDDSSLITWWACWELRAREPLTPNLQDPSGTGM